MKDLLKRKGIVKINDAVFNTLQPKMLKMIFSEFYPINIDFEGFNDKVYYGVSNHFDKIIEGEAIPEYVIVINAYNVESENEFKSQTEYTIEFEKI